MNETISKATNKIREVVEGAKELASENKGVILGGIAMYLLADNEKAKSALLGAIGGKVLVDEPKKDKEEDEE